MTPKPSGETEYAPAQYVHAPGAGSTSSSPIVAVIVPLEPLAGLFRAAEMVEQRDGAKGVWDDEVRCALEWAREFLGPHAGRMSHVR
jgi:hypothetical protein